MKKSVILLATIATTFAVAQVGINTTNPQATLDITARTSDGSKAEGLLAPRLTGNQIQAADMQYNAPQSGTLVYATAGATSPSVKTANITAAGYYFFDGSLWQRVTTGAGINIYNTNSMLTANRTVNQSTNTLAFTSTASTGTNHFSVDGSTLSVDAVNNRVGIGTTTPSARLQISGDGTSPPLKIDNTINQPGSGSFAYLTIDNTNGNIYKGTQASQAFYYQKYNLTNVNLDWVQDFNTRIPTSTYTLVVVGTAFNAGLSVANADSINDVFYAQNVFAYPSAGTWRISADFPNATTIGSVNGTWIIYTMILSNNQVVNNADVTVNLGGSNTGTATASPVP